jgi:hypothetical protein
MRKDEFQQRVITLLGDIRGMLTEPAPVNIVMDAPWAGDSRFHMPGDGHPDTNEKPEFREVTDAEYTPEPDTYGPNMFGDAVCTAACREMHTLQEGCVLAGGAAKGTTDASADYQPADEYQVNIDIAGFGRAESRIVVQRMHDVRLVGKASGRVELTCNPCGWKFGWVDDARPKPADLAAISEDHEEGRI